MECLLRVLPDNMVVYTRTPRKTGQTIGPAPSPAADFISKVSKPVEVLVPVPAVQKRRAKTAGPISLPRRSRRIAKLPPESDRASASLVCRKLGLTEEDGRISDEALYRYTKSYNHLLGQDHLAAVAALFGWEVPPEDQVRVAIAPVIVV